MHEAELVIDTILELMDRGLGYDQQQQENEDAKNGKGDSKSAKAKENCNGHAKIKLGHLVADPDKFKTLFRLFTRGTELDHVQLDIEDIPPKVSCDCGFSGQITLPSHVRSASCPRCKKKVDIVQGREFKIVYPPQP